MSRWFVVTMDLRDVRFQLAYTCCNVKIVVILITEPRMISLKYYESSNLKYINGLSSIIKLLFICFSYTYRNRKF